ncbi:MAG: hypothetical protein WD269_09355 [Acidimicrobiia bacterium]
MSDQTGGGRAQTVPRRWVRFGALAGLVVAVALVGLVVVFEWGGATTDYPLLITALTSVVVGYLILIRTDGNRVGWALMMLTISMAGAGVAGWVSDQGNLIGDAIGGAMWFLLLVSMSFLIYWFPTGRAVSSRWRWVGWLGSILTFQALSYMFVEEVCVDEGDVCQAWAPNPIGIPRIPNPEYGPFADIGLLLVFGFLLAAVTSLIFRFVRARGVERLQLRWLAVAGVILLVGILISDRVPVSDQAANMLFGISMLGLPLAVGASVLRYRLYEIDRIISRTVSYAVIVGVLGLVLFGLVAGLGAWVGRDNQLVVAVSTLAVAALFSPVRRRVQGWVDRRFNRSRYDAERVMSEFAGSLRDRVDPDGVVEGWVGVVTQTMQPSSVGVWVR